MLFPLLQGWTAWTKMYLCSRQSSAWTPKLKSPPTACKPLPCLPINVYRSEAWWYDWNSRFVGERSLQQKKICKKDVKKACNVMNYHSFIFLHLPQISTKKIAMRRPSLQQKQVTGSALTSLWIRECHLSFCKITLSRDTLDPRKGKRNYQSTSWSLPTGVTIMLPK